MTSVESVAEMNSEIIIIQYHIQGLPLVKQYGAPAILDNESAVPLIIIFIIIFMWCKMTFLSVQWWCTVYSVQWPLSTLVDSGHCQNSWVRQGNYGLKGQGDYGLKGQGDYGLKGQGDYGLKGQGD